MSARPAVNGAMPVARIAVGLDASTPGAVIEWAAAEAAARGAALDVVAFGTEGGPDGDEAAHPNALLSYASHADLVIVGRSADFGPARVGFGPASPASPRDGPRARSSSCAARPDNR